MSKDVIRLFRGVDRSLEPHLLQEGSLLDMTNFHSRQGALEKRKGYEILQELPITDAKFYWPSLIYHFDFPFSTADDDEGDTNANLFVSGNGAIFFVPPGQPVIGPFSPPVINVIFDPVNLPPELIAFKTTLNPTIPTVVEQNVAFNLTITAQFKNGDTNALYNGTGADIRHDLMNSVTGVIIAEDVLQLAGGGALDITNAANWTNGVYSKSVEFLDDQAADRLIVSAYNVFPHGGTDTAEILVHGIEFLFEETDGIIAFDSLGDNDASFSDSNLSRVAMGLDQGMRVNATATFDATTDLSPIFEYLGDYTITFDLRLSPQSAPSDTELNILRLFAKTAGREFELHVFTDQAIPSEEGKLIMLDGGTPSAKTSIRVDDGVIREIKIVRTVTGPPAHKFELFLDGVLDVTMVTAAPPVVADHNQLAIGAQAGDPITNIDYNDFRWVQ